MKCPKCVEEGKKSTVTSKGSQSTLMAYTTTYDEEGNVHHHDRNRVSSYFECSNGHAFAKIRRGTNCPSYPDNCDFGGFEEETGIIIG